MPIDFGTERAIDLDRTGAPTEEVRQSAEYLVFGRPKLSETEIAAVTQVLRSGWIGTGPKVGQFEAAFRSYIGTSHSVAVSSCTAALELTLLACDVGPGDEVITTPLTFAATLNAIVHVGATPVLVDVDSVTGNIDPEQIAAAITGRTRAIIPVSLAGMPLDVAKLEALRQRYGVRIIQDCAHAIEASWGGRNLGTYLDAACYSFYPTKNITTIEGGMVCSNDPELIERVRQISQHGISKDAWKRFSTTSYSHYDVVAAGHKANMTDVQAALGLAQLETIDEKLRRRQEVWSLYRQYLADLPLELPAEAPANTRHARHLYSVRVDLERSARTRDQWMTGLHEYGIGTGVHYRSIPRLSFFQERFGWKPEQFPVADSIGERTFSLPLTPYLTELQVASVIKAMHAVKG